jgi:tRNA threonylcarbamoyladenosine biosynthesis protein TsaE
MYHMDFYRIDSDQEVFEMGLADYFYKNGIVLLEWYTRVENIIPADYLAMHIQVTGITSRLVSFITTSKTWQDRVEHLRESLKS